MRNAISNAPFAMPSDSKASQRDHQPGLLDQLRESQRCAYFDVTDDVTNASASAFGHSHIPHGRYHLDAGNSPLHSPTYHILPRHGPQKQVFHNTGPPSSDSSLEVKGSMRKWADSSTVTVNARVSIRVQFEFPDHKLESANYKEVRELLVREEIKVRAMEVLQRYLGEDRSCRSDEMKSCVRRLRGCAMYLHREISDFCFRRGSPCTHLQING
jgi:hypothetical protein